MDLDQSGHAVLQPVQNFGSPSAQHGLTSWSAERGLPFPGQEPTHCCCGSYLPAARTGNDVLQTQGHQLGTSIRQELLETLLAFRNVSVRTLFTSLGFLSFL